MQNRSQSWNLSRKRNKIWFEKRNKVLHDGVFIKVLSNIENSVANSKNTREVLAIRGYNKTRAKKSKIFCPANKLAEALIKL